MLKNNLILIIFALSLGISSRLKAQDEINDNLAFGLHVIPQTAWLTPETNNLKSNGVDLNFNFGFNFKYKLNSKYALSAEANINNMISKLQHSNIISEHNNITDTSDVNFNYNLRYLEFPLLVSMQTKEFNNIRFYGEFGMAFGFLIRSKADVNFGTVSISNMDVDNPIDEEKVILKDVKTGNSYDNTLESFRPSFIIGAGFMFNILESTMLTTGIRFNAGFKDILKEEKWNATNSSIGLNLGIIF